MAAQGTNLHDSEIKVLSSASQVQEIILSVYSDTFRSRNSIKIQRPSERYQNITLLFYDGNFTGRLSFAHGTLSSKRQLRQSLHQFHVEDRMETVLHGLR